MAEKPFWRQLLGVIVGSAPDAAGPPEPPPIAAASGAFAVDALVFARKFGVRRIAARGPLGKFVPSDTLPVTTQGQAVSNADVEVFELRLDGDDGRFWIPVAEATTHLRQLITRAEADVLLAQLRSPLPDSPDEPWPKRYAATLQVIASGDASQFVGALRALQGVRARRPLVHGEQRLLDTLRGFVGPELVAVCGLLDAETTRLLE